MDSTTNVESLSALEQKLLNMNIKKFVPFNLDGNKLTCKVLRVHDGDTASVGTKISNKYVKVNIRWLGLDCPELHSKVPKESKLCRLGRNYVINNYLNKLVVVEMGPMDLYGRVLATVYDKTTGESINDKMIKYKFARAYGTDGTDLHKNDWSESELDAGITIAGGMGLVDN